MKIMIVENNKKMQETIRNIVQNSSFAPIEIATCTDGYDAVTKYKDFKPDWLLMDIALERLNGLKASQKIRQIAPAAKIIIVTQYDEPEYREAAKEMGAYAFVLKDNLLKIPVIIESIL